MKVSSLRFKFFFLILIELALVFGFYVSSLLNNTENVYRHEKVLSQRFLLTDFCFSTESRHTRHISMPELIAPFQDLPGFHDHFPSSSFFHPQHKQQKP